MHARGIVFVQLYSASRSAHKSEVLSVRETKREESSLRSPVNKKLRAKSSKLNTHTMIQRYKAYVTLLEVYLFRNKDCSGFGDDISSV